ncbi:MAG: hypothetical protein U0172_02795 [Nitrospiraceae bacterium]
MTETGSRFDTQSAQPDTSFKPSLRVFSQLGFGLALWMLAGCAGTSDVEAGQGLGTPTTEATHQALTPYTWHDGTREHRLWMDPSIVAEFVPDATPSSTLSHATILAERPANRTRIRFWRADQGTQASDLLASAAQRKSTTALSPVLRDTPSTSGSVRLLPGNILVTLNPTWNADAVNAWANRHALRILQHLPYAPNMLLVESAPGLATLELATRLARSGDVHHVEPDWLTEKTLK